MGIDIYLNGYEAYEKRIAAENAAFNKAVAARDRHPRGSKAAERAQIKVSKASEAMWSGAKGYLRSSYNGSGLFRVLEEIFGFDMAAYFFPGDWDADNDIRIDGREFVLKVQALQAAATLAMTRRNLELPWINEYSEVTGKAAPDPNAARSRAEAFGDSVFAMFAQLAAGGDRVEGGPAETKPRLQPGHQWYLTEGLTDLGDFGELARELNERGEETFAHISF